MYINTSIRVFGVDTIRMLSLRELSQNTNKETVRACFIQGIKKCELEYNEVSKNMRIVAQMDNMKMRETLIAEIDACENPRDRNKKIAKINSKMPMSVVVPNELLPSYNFNLLFKEALLKNYLPEYCDVFGYVLSQSARENDNKLASFCVSSCVKPKLQNRFMQFMEFVFTVDKQAAGNIMEHYSAWLQIDILNDNFLLHNLEKVLYWDRVLGAPLMMDPTDSHMHNLMRTALDKPNHSNDTSTSTACIFERLKRIVEHHGTIYLKNIPSEDCRANDTLISTVLHFGDVSNHDNITCELLSYLIHTLPSTLRIPGCSPYRHNAYSAVVLRCKDTTNEQHKWIVENVMYYVELQHDLFGIIQGTRHQTLLQMIRQEKNTLVLNYIQRKFPVLEPFLLSQATIPDSFYSFKQMTTHTGHALYSPIQ